MFPILRQAVRRTAILKQPHLIRLSSTLSTRCPSCNSPLPSAIPACPKCNNIQPLDPSASYYDIFGLSELTNPFAVDVKDLRYRFLQAQRVCHPDAWSNRGPKAQNIAAAQSSMLNKAYQTLLSPLSRAEYILAKNGYPVSETDKLDDEEFIVEVLDIREDLETATTADEVERILRENNDRIQECCEELEKLLGQAQWQAASAVAMKLKYWQSIDDAIKEKKG